MNDMIIAFIIYAIGYVTALIVGFIINRLTKIGFYTTFTRHESFELNEAAFAALFSWFMVLLFLLGIIIELFNKMFNYDKINKWYTGKDE